MKADGGSNYTSLSLSGVFNFADNSDKTDHVETLRLEFQRTQVGSDVFWLATHVVDLEWYARVSAPCIGCEACCELYSDCPEDCCSLYDGFAMTHLFVMVSFRDALPFYGTTYRKGIDNAGRVVPVPNNPHEEADTVYQFTTHQDRGFWERQFSVCALLLGTWRSPRIVWDVGFNCELSLQQESELCANIDSISPHPHTPHKTCSVSLFVQDSDGHWSLRSLQVRLHQPIEKDRLLAASPLTVWDGVRAAVAIGPVPERTSNISICAENDFSFTWGTVIQDSVSEVWSFGVEQAIEAQFQKAFSISVSLEKMRSLGVNLCSNNLEADAGEHIIPIFVPFGEKELWLCDVYSTSGFVKQVQVCNYTPRPPSPPYLSFSYIRVPMWVRRSDIHKWIRENAGFCPPEERSEW